MTSAPYTKHGVAAERDADKVLIAATKPDGRLNRSLVTRQKIVDALASLISNGVLLPTADQVAAQANIGLRTVFSHFEDMETLYRQISQKIEEVLAPTKKMHLSGDTWQARLSDAIAKRCELFDKVAPYHLASQAVRHQSAYVHDKLIASAQVQRGLLTHVLPANLSANQLTLESLDVATSLDTWIRLRREQGLDATAAQQVVRHLVTQLTGSQLP